MLRILRRVAGAAERGHNGKAATDAALPILAVMAAGKHYGQQMNTITLLGPFMDLFDQGVEVGLTRSRSAVTCITLERVLPQPRLEILLTDERQRASGLRHGTVARQALRHEPRAARQGQQGQDRVDTERESTSRRAFVRHVECGFTSLAIRSRPFTPLRRPRK